MSVEGSYPPDHLQALKQGRRANAGRRVRPNVTVVRAAADAEDPRGPDGVALIDEIVREGARRMLAEALQAAVDTYIARFAGERDKPLLSRARARSMVSCPIPMFGAAWPRLR
jgi:hypothetical protein